ncbi:uncharacterized protein VNE69_01228 [Vairimorpha necatrix]|uniref:Uncharacterized protein n=1 Tax=Vairimorpha necatrix TaxID=6039 RepID=A0AAX4J8P6_9MICR
MDNEFLNGLILSYNKIIREIKIFKDELNLIRNEIKDLSNKVIKEQEKKPVLKKPIPLDLSVKNSQYFNQDRILYSEKIKTFIPATQQNQTLPLTNNHKKRPKRAIPKKKQEYYENNKRKRSEFFLNLGNNSSN